MAQVSGAMAPKGKYEHARLNKAADVAAEAAVKDVKEFYKSDFKIDCRWDLI